MTSSVSPKELRLMLSMALIRFVNGFVDAQQQGIYAVTALSGRGHDRGRTRDSRK
ncbi:hypothetical protein BDF22DRAFT_690875 [Syncephalis plumigaleata]|nr:hypothetical protein BDF22DRAFT_690875 [Syncephalis plumigaleata]